MDERVQAMLDSVRQTAADAGSAAADAACGAGRRAAELLGAAKLNIRLAELRAEADDGLREVGKLIYATHTGDPTGSDVLLEKLRKIDGVYAEIAACRTEQARLRGGAACPVCGQRAKAGDVYCGGCGAKL